MDKGIKKKPKYYLIVKYKPDENNNKVKILDKIFISRNRNKCKIIYKNKFYNLKEFFEDIDRTYNYKDLIKFKILFLHDIIA